MLICKVNSQNNSARLIFSAASHRCFGDGEAFYSLNREGEFRAPQRHCGSFFPFWTRQLVVVVFLFSLSLSHFLKSQHGH